MPKILLISDESNESENIIELLHDIGHEVRMVSEPQETLEQSTEFVPDIAIINTPCSKLNVFQVCKKLKLQVDNSDIQIILLTSDDKSSREVLIPADGYITKPFNDNILIATVNAHLRMKDLLNILYTNNRKLATSLFQLNTLYNTSSQLAGTLDKAKLISIMNEGLEKSLNFVLSTALIINNPEDATLIVNSEHSITERLEEALKLRAIIGYKNLFEDQTPPFELSFKNIKTEIKVKDKHETYDIELLDNENIFSPISTNDKFFGTVEILRKNEFKQEDITCFQTVVNQVALPLESAILYEEIKKTNAKLEKLEKLKSEFISIVSHELRTPLTAINNSLDIMLSGKTGEVTKQMDNFLSMAKRNVSRLSGIINDLLDLSKIEAGKMDFRFKEANILEPVEFVISTFENLAQKKNIDLRIEAQQNLPPIYGDIVRIEQVLSNLVSNAIKFTNDHGEITIRVETLSPKEVLGCVSNRENLLKTPYVKVSVCDSGIGIAEEDIPKVFDKFHQIENSLSRKVGGTGLGLPIAKQLIDTHRGKIWLESEVNKGTTFSFIVPVVSEETIFYMDLDNELQQIKHNHSWLSMIYVEEKAVNASLLDDINNNKINVIRKRENSKFFIQNDRMLIILPNMSKKIATNIQKRIKNQYKENDAYKKCSVKSSIVVYPEDAITTDEMISAAKKALKK